MDKDTLIRLKEEHQELLERLTKLVGFINSKDFFHLSNGYREVLMRQKAAMELYIGCLSERLYNF